MEKLYVEIEGHNEFDEYGGVISFVVDACNYNDTGEEPPVGFVEEFTALMNKHNWKF